MIPFIVFYLLLWFFCICEAKNVLLSDIFIKKVHISKIVSKIVIDTSLKIVKFRLN